MASNSSHGLLIQHRASIDGAESDTQSRADHTDIDHHENHHEERHEALSKDDVYRRLYAILSLLAFAIFSINILQVCLLNLMTNWYWIILFPLCVFGVFMTWATKEVFDHLSSFRTEDANIKEGVTHIRLHLIGLLHPQGKGRPRPTVGAEKKWPTRFDRASVLLTILLNVVLIEFVYLPIFAVPTFKQQTWDVDIMTTLPLKTPAVAVIQTLDDTLQQWAHLPADDQIWQDLCDFTRNPSDPTERCISNSTSETTGGQSEDLHVRYAIFDPSVLPSLPLYQAMNLWYPYTYDGYAGTIITTVAFFDPALIPHFPIALRCGALTRVQIGTFPWYQIQLRPFSVSDHLNAMDRTDECDVAALEHYMGYEPSITYLGPQTTGGGNDCNFESSGFNGTCNGVMQVMLGSGLTTTYQSRHGKDSIAILTDEGGIVGFITFLTWFLGIFKM